MRIGGGAPARDWPHRSLLPCRLPGYKAPQSLGLRPQQRLRLRRRNSSSLTGRELSGRGEDPRSSPHPTPRPVPSAKLWSREARPGTRAPWPLGPQKVKGFPLGDREPLVSAVPNLQGFRSPRRAAGAAFCPVPGKPWRKGREGQKGRGKSGRGEATTARKCLGAAAEPSQAEPGGDAGSGAAGRSSVRDALPDSFPTCTKRSRLPDPPPRLVGGWEENAIPISQVEKLRFKRAKGLGWKQGLPVPTPASGSAALKSPARAHKPEPQTGSTTREASGQGRIRRGRDKEMTPDSPLP